MPDSPAPRRLRTVLIATAVVVAIGLAATVVAVGLSNRADENSVTQQSATSTAVVVAPNGPVTSAPVSAPDSSGAPTTVTDTPATADSPFQPRPAERVEPVFDWRIVDDPQVGLGPDFAHFNSQTTGAYAVSTMPGRNKVAERVVYRSDDGINWAATSTTPLRNLWLMDVVAGPTDQQVYGIGTAPSADAANVPDIVRATSSDGGATFDVQRFPIDLPRVRKDLGFTFVGGSQLASTADVTVAALTVGGFPNPTDILPDGVDAPFGATLGLDGIDIYAAPDDIDTIAASVCPGGWALQKGPPALRATDGTGPQPTIVFAPGGKGGRDIWHCAAPAGSGQDDVFVDGSQVHGDVARSIPFDQLGFGADTVKALRQLPRVFTTVDGATWSEVAMPPAAVGGVEFLVSGPSGFAMTLATNNLATGSTRTLWTSADGTTWQQRQIPQGLGVTSLTIDPSGGLLLTGFVGKYLAVARSADGQSWTESSLNGLIGNDPSLRIYPERVVSSAAGLLVLVNVTRDALAAKGGTTLRHGDLTLRVEDLNNTFTLLDQDNKVVDVMSGYSGVLSSGALRQAPSGIGVVDVTTGHVLTTFAWPEIQHAIDTVVPQQQIVKGGPGESVVRYVLSSTDGRHWAAEQLATIGLIGGQSLYSTNAFATADSLILTFNNGTNCCQPNQPPAPPIALVATPAG